MNQFFSRTIALLFLLSFSYQTIAMQVAHKKVLSIGPGALLGYIIIQVLEEMEERTGRPVIEVFDFIGGTSTGAVIASLLSRGYSAKEVREFYEQFAVEIFSKKTKSISDVISSKDVEDLTNQILQLFTPSLTLIGCTIDADTFLELKSRFTSGDQEQFLSLVENLITPIMPLR